jgi:hypothetical protein
MNIQGWCRRLESQLPGWQVWYWSAGGKPGTAGWYAAPAPPEADRAEVLLLPHRLGPYPTPQELRAEARVRYGWGDTCDTCGDGWQLCGHRQDETREDWNSLHGPRVRV